MEIIGLSDDIKSHSTERQFPDGKRYFGIGCDSVLQISEKRNISPVQVEIAALEIEIIPERYVRNMRSFSSQDQAKLLRSTVSVIGLGGLGGGVTEILARIGVGSLILVDGEVFEESNLNRQLLSAHSLIQTSKSDAAYRRVREINSSINVKIHSVSITDHNVEEIVRGSNVTVDCLDNLPSRFILEKAARSVGIPMVSAAIAGESGHITVIFPEDPGLQLIYGDLTPESFIGVERSLGCLPYAVHLLSSLECSEVIKILLNRRTNLRNKLMIIDLSDNTFETLNLCP